MSVWAERQPRSFRQRAESAVDEHYRALEKEIVDKVARKLSARNMRLDRSDIEEAYCQAWHGVYERIAEGVSIASLHGMLVEITWRRAVETYREMHIGEYADVDIEAHVVEVDLDQRLDDQAKLQRLLRRVKGRLNPQERQVISLCWIHGYTRPEARALLGIKNEARMQKLMDRASKKVGGIVAAVEARGCGGDEWSQMLRSYALGTIDEQQSDYRRAREHIENCASCCRYVVGLRRVAAIVPPFLPGGPDPTQVLAFLHRLFGGHGGTGAAASTLPTGTTAVSGASAAGGGATLMGSLGSAKVAAVIVVAAAAGATTAIHDGEGHRARHAHHRAARVAARHSSTLGHTAGIPPTLPRSEDTGARAGRQSQTTQHARVATAGHSGALQKEFGFEGGQAGRSEQSAPPVTAATASARSNSSTLGSSSASSSQAGASIRAVQREFGPER
jgi:DNA-directed RNA polymerase specialized sigma24 family protein